MRLFVIKKSKHPVRSEIIAFVLLTVLSVALLAAPQSLLSQSNEQSAETPAAKPFSINATPDSVFRGGISRLDKESGEIIDILNDGSVTFMEIEQTLSQLDLDMELGINERIKIDFAKQDGRIAANVEVFNVVDVLNQLGIPLENRIAAPILIHKVEPIYPETAKESGIFGEVLLRVSTDEKGETTWVSAIDGHPKLTEAAVTAVGQWRYNPALSSGNKPISTIFGVLIRFLPNGTINSELGRSFFIED